MKEVLKKEVNTLKLDKKIIGILNSKNIDTVYKLCNCSRMELASIGLSNNEINKLIIVMQLNGLDLKKNHAKKNSIILN